MRDEDFQAYLSWMEKYVTTRRVQYAVVNDVREAPPPSAYQRQLVAAQMARLDSFTRQYCAGFAFVVDSTLMRGIMTAILWLNKPGYPTHVCGDVKSATAWCTTQLALSPTDRPAR